MSLPPLSSATASLSSPSPPPALPRRLPSFTRARTPLPPPSTSHYHQPHQHGSSASSSAASSPATSPVTHHRHSQNQQQHSPQQYAAVSGMKRLRVAHTTNASVHPSEHAVMLVNTQRKANRQEEDVFISGAYKSQRKPAQNATHELRSLRQDAAQMEYQIQVLRAHWKQQLPDRKVLLRACEAAKSKWITTQAEELNRQLKEQLLQQQLYLASLQNLVLQSPFFDQSRSKEVFEAVHTYMQLSDSLNEKQRRDQLHAHCDIGIRMAPSIVNRFLRPHAQKATVETPFSHTSIMCDGDFTFASNLLVCRIPHSSLLAVADAVAVYFASLQHEVKNHIGLVGEFKLIEHLTDINHYAQIKYQNGPDITSVMNTTFASHVNEDRAIFVSDFVDDDVLYPVRKQGDGSTMRDTCLTLVLVPTIDEFTGQPQILLQRVATTRYNLPPNSRAVHHDIKSTLQWFNGDLLLKVICQQLEEQQGRAV